MKYYGGCDVGSTYTKAVILDENGKICADTTIRSKINSEVSAKLAMEEVLNKVGLNSSEELGYLIGTGYGRNKVPFADENISEISCHAMGVHVTDPSVKAIIDIGGQDVKGISIDTDGTVNYSYVYYAVFAPRPAFNLKSSIVVSDSTDSDGCYTVESVPGNDGGLYVKNNGLWVRAV